MHMADDYLAGVTLADDTFGEQITAWFAQVFASYWLRMTDPADPVATALNTLPKHVMTTTLSTVDWNGSSIAAGDVAGQIGALKAKPGREPQVHGSPTLVRYLLAEGLLDELRLMIFPVVVGCRRPTDPAQCGSGCSWPCG